ncbi:MAG TPA: tetratricopeptide repeat protein [Pyrinomonadaceae bacterium]|nr:tetratricopeptide repeat protein [Pyrinomonadaceae bacterium]
MSKMFMYASRAFVVALLMCFAVWGAGAVVSAQQPSGQNNPPKKKKLPPGAKGFEQFAGRDASDKLVTGGATRGECTTYEQLIECAMGQAGSTPPNLQAAIDFFTQAAKLKPEMFRPHYNLGQIYEEQGKYKEAVAAYKRAITLKVDESMGEQPESILSAYYNLANVYAVTNQHEQAITTFQEVIRRLPKVATTHYNVGLSQAALGKHRDAINSFNEAIKLKEDYSEAYYNLGVAHSKLEEYPQAVAAFKKALEYNPEYALARYNLGVAYYMMDDAKALAGEVQALQKTQPELAKELAKLNGGK